MKLRETRSNRLKLSTDNTETIKWTSVMMIALIAQISVASVHLERRGPQIAALSIFTSAIIVLFSLIALHELPFAPPLVVKPTPLSDLLDIVPESAS
jgi:heme A synthase